MKRKGTPRLLPMLLCLTMMLGMRPVAGAAAADTCNHGSHAGWTAVPAGSTYIPTTGNVKLEGDVMLLMPVEVTGDLHICLNGKTIHGGAKTLFRVSGNGSLTICDCVGAGVVGSADGELHIKGAIVNVVDNGVFNLYGGTLSGNKSTGSWGGAVEVTGNGTFNMYGGALTRNSTKHYGGAVSVIDTATFVMNGGVISDNSNENLHGGAIALDNGTSKVIINDGLLTGNTAPLGGVIGTRGAGGSVTINGGVFAGNTATGEGGGVIYGALDLTINGGTFTNNKGKSGCVVLLSNRRLTLTGGTFVDNKNTAPAYFGSIHLSTSASTELDISGAPVMEQHGISGKASSANIHDLKADAEVYSWFALDKDAAVTENSRAAEGKIKYTATGAAAATSGADAMQDVKKGAWFYDAVKYAVNSKIMSGYNANTFGPNDTLTRAMVVQVLYNKEGKPALNGLKNSFKDVPAGQWYSSAITWGANKGVVSGYGGNVFKPDQAVSIEQVAVILHNYSGKPAGNGDLSKAPGCSDWAASALKWAVEKGLLEGMPFGKITDNATRAQTAYMLMKFLKK